MKQPVTYLCAPRLQKYIASYGVHEIPEGANESYFTPPIGKSGIILQTINTRNLVIAKMGEEDFFTERAIVVGQITKPVQGEIIGMTKILLVFFHPLGMHQLFGTDMVTLTDTSMTLKEFMGEERCEELMLLLKADQNTDRQIEVLDQFFMDISPAGEDTSKLERVLDFIHKQNGGVNVQDLEQNGFYHRKTLERHFKKMIGLSPKVYAQIYRFKSLIKLIRRHPEITWSQLADQAGYYDQSHMSHYVKEYLQVSPNSMVQLDMEMINYLLSR